jgi:AbrB family looped-hinge helix DNA binding protein
MSATTLSAKFQISIPKDVREEMGLKPGQKFEFLRIGRTLKLVPQPRMEDLFGIAEENFIFLKIFNDVVIGVKNLAPIKL